MRIRSIIFLTITLLCFQLPAQVVDSVQGKIESVRGKVEVLPGIQVRGQSEFVSVDAVLPTQVMTNKTLSVLPAVQVSDVLKLMSGVVIKDYGGVGGMKTVAVRGFSSQHTAVAYDGVVVADGQTGQIDLSRFSLQNAGAVQLVMGPTGGTLSAARPAGAAGTLFIHSPFMPDFTYDRQRLHLDACFTGGSFGLINPSLKIDNLILKDTVSRTTISSSLIINYLQSKGDYPFTIYYGAAGDSTSRERRENSDVKTFNIEENLRFTFHYRTVLTAKFYYYQSERGLPGAVLFYTVKNGQRLYDQNAFGQVTLQVPTFSGWTYRMLAKFNFSGQRYYDGAYLNVAGFLDNRYFQREYYLSNIVQFQPIKIFEISLANDLIFGNMNTNLTDFVTPSRLQVLTALTAAVRTHFPEINAQVRLLHTGVANWVQRGTAAKNLSRFTPAASFSINLLGKKPSIDLYFRTYYQNIYRIPTFNDLYYNEVGNTNLRPENAHQVNAGVTFARSFVKTQKMVGNEPFDNVYLEKRFEMNVTATLDGYYNRVKDKIVAIPSKNLFVWSMLNFGKVEMSGLDATATTTFNYNPSCFKSASLSGSYSLQRAVDKTDPAGKTYGHQIPYTPLHSGSLSALVEFSWSRRCNLKIGYTMVAAGKRYSLQQNVPQNELAPYTDHSLSLSTEFTLGNRRHTRAYDQCKLGLKAELLNLADKHYEVIRNYPMQGRSFRLTGWVKL